MNTVFDEADDMKEELEVIPEDIVNQIPTPLRNKRI